MMINDWIVGKLNKIVSALDPSAARLPGCFQPSQHTPDPLPVCLRATCHRAADDARSHAQFISFLHTLAKARSVMKIPNSRKNSKDETLCLIDCRSSKLLKAGALGGSRG